METEKSPVIHRAMTDDEKRRYNSDMKKSVASFIGEIATLCKDVHAELPTSEPPKLVEVIPKMWMKETAQTLEAIRLLYEKDFSVQSLMLCRSLLEIYDATLWLFENALTTKTDVETSAEVRANLLALSTYSAFDRRMEKLDLKEYELIRNEPHGQFFIEAQKFHYDFLLKTPAAFSNEKEIKAAVKAIGTYPKPEKAVLEKFNPSDYSAADYTWLYSQLSSAVHSKDISLLNSNGMSSTDWVRATNDMLSILMSINTVFAVIKTTTSALGISLPESIESRMKALDERHQTLLFIMPDDEG